MKRMLEWSKNHFLLSRLEFPPLFCTPGKTDKNIVWRVFFWKRQQMIRPSESIFCFSYTHNRVKKSRLKKMITINHKSKGKATKEIGEEGDLETQIKIIRRWRFKMEGYPWMKEGIRMVGSVLTEIHSKWLSMFHWGFAINKLSL